MKTLKQLRDELFDIKMAMRLAYTAQEWIDAIAADAAWMKENGEDLKRLAQDDT